MNEALVTYFCVTKEFNQTVMRKYLLLFGLFFFVSSCAALRDFADVRAPSVDFSNMSIQSISFDGVTLLFDFDVTNPNQFGVTADEYSYEFFINENSFLSGTQRENLRISRESTSLVQVPVSLNFSEVFNTFSSLVRRDSLSYELSTIVQFDVPGLGLRQVPISAAGELPVPRMPRIEFGGLNVRNMSLSGAELDIGFRVTNPNSFGLSMRNAAYVLNVNGREWLNTRLGDTVRLDASESDMIIIPIRLNASQMGSVLIDMMRGTTEFDYNLSGSAEISADIEGFEDGTSVPFDLDGTYTAE